MKINGNDFFMGAYLERKNQADTNSSGIKLSQNQAERINIGIKQALSSLNTQTGNVRVSVSKEDMDFLCSDAGFKKMKADALELYKLNAEQQKKININKNGDDVFWEHTGDQWLAFSKMLNDEGFYNGMSDDDVKKMENVLSDITAGMDHLSRSQYHTGIVFSDAKDSFHFFMSRADVLTELESSSSALKYFSDKFLTGIAKEGFDKLIEDYRRHNEEIITNYVNPMESFHKIVAGINKTAKEFVSETPVDDYKFSVQMGNIAKSGTEEAAYRKNIQDIFDLYYPSHDYDNLLGKIKEQFVRYTTDESNDDEFKDYVLKQSNYLFKHMANMWDRLEKCEYTIESDGHIHVSPTSS